MMQFNPAQSSTVLNFTTTLFCQAVLHCLKALTNDYKSNYKREQTKDQRFSTKTFPQQKRRRLLVQYLKTLSNDMPFGSEAVCWVHKNTSLKFAKAEKSTKKLDLVFADTMLSSNHECKLYLFY